MVWQTEVCRPDGHHLLCRIHNNSYLYICRWLSAGEYGLRTNNLIDIAPFIEERELPNKRIRDTFEFAIANYNGTPSAETLYVWANDILSAASLQQSPKKKHNITIVDLLEKVNV